MLLRRIDFVYYCILWLLLRHVRRISVIFSLIIVNSLFRLELFLLIYWFLRRCNHSLLNDSILRRLFSDDHFIWNNIWANISWRHRYYFLIDGIFEILFFFDSLIDSIDRNLNHFLLWQFCLVLQSMLNDGALYLIIWRMINFGISDGLFNKAKWSGLLQRNLIVKGLILKMSFSLYFWREDTLVRTNSNWVENWWG